MTGELLKSESSCPSSDDDGNVSHDEEDEGDDCGVGDGDGDDEYEREDGEGEDDRAIGLSDRIVVICTAIASK